MNKKGVTLFIFEGEKDETKIRSSFSNFFKDQLIDNDNAVELIWGATIYQLWQEIKNDDSLDIVEVLKEKSTSGNQGNPKKSNIEKIAGINRRDIIQIYLFFDHDGHSDNIPTSEGKSNDEIISAMLELFNDETEHGKLYISYPMAQAIKHLDKNDSLKDICWPISANSTYKKHIGDLAKFHHYDKIDWKLVSKENIKKANQIINSTYSLFSYTDIDTSASQQNIHTNQCDKYIIPKGQVAVISAFPMFLVEYFNEETVNTLFLFS